MRRLALALALLAAAPALAFPANIQPRGSAAGTPSLSNLTGSVIAAAASGTAVMTPIVSGLSGCSWSIAPTTYFAQSSSTGAVTTTSTPTTVGTYNPVTTCSATAAGITVSVSGTLSITATAGSYTPSLDHGDARNSQYFAIIL